MKEVNKSELPFKVYKMADRFKQLKFLLYGPIGCGMEKVAGSIVDVEGRDSVLGIAAGNNMISLAEDGYDLKMTLAEMEGYAEGPNNYMQMQNYISSNIDSFDTLVLTSLSDIQGFMLRESVAAAGKAEPDLKVYASVGAKMSDLLMRMRSLPVTMILTVGEQEYKNENTGAIKVIPDLIGKSAHKIADMFDVVGRVSLVKDKQGEVRRVIEFQNEKLSVKDNTNALGRNMPDPTMKKLYDKIRAKHNIGE